MKKSYFSIPLSFLFHLAAINGIFYLFIPEIYRDGRAILYFNICWIIVTYSINFYPTSWNERFMTNVVNFGRLFIIYGLFYLSAFALFGKASYRAPYLILVYALLCLVLVLFRIAFYWIKKIYRKKYFMPRRVVVVGWDRNLKKIKSIFDYAKEDYSYVGFFADKNSRSTTYLGKIEEALDYILENSIDEIYCIASELSRQQINQFVTVADNNLKKIKIIPDNKELFRRNMEIQLYGSVPVLSLRSSPLEREYAHLVKRGFDIFFALLVIICICSWLFPIVALLIKLDSKGPVFFVQRRHGVNKKEFSCYKFRSMKLNDSCDSKMAEKNDDRITPLGHFLRKINIDELPQFFNVLIGDMSVVGPRPHMVNHTKKYQEGVQKYLVRHFLKPGITGLAQVRGYRGEIIEKSDIVNRINYDIFYFEKWSLGLDLYIILQTVLNVFRGESKAY